VILDRVAGKRRKNAGEVSHGECIKGELWLVSGLVGSDDATVEDPHAVGGAVASAARIYPVEVSAVFAYRLNRFTVFGIPRPDVEHLRASITDIWADSPGGWVFERFAFYRDRY